MLNIKKKERNRRGSADAPQNHMVGKSDGETGEIKSLRLSKKIKDRDIYSK